jgi:hypothetical protein
VTVLHAAHVPADVLHDLREQVAVDHPEVELVVLSAGFTYAAFAVGVQ